MAQKDDIIFEDLHGNPDEVIDVDLDADEEPGIKRRSHEANDDDDLDSGAGDVSARGADDDEGVDDDDDTAARLAQAEAEAREAREALERYRNQQESDRRKAEQEAIGRLDSEISSIEEQLEEAIEHGDTKKQVRLTSQLTDLKAKKLSAELRFTADPEPQQAKAKGSSNPKIAAWMNKNRWYNQPGKERFTRITNRIDRDIANEGYDPTSDEYWAELDLRLKREAPELFEKPSRGGDRVAPVGDGGGDRTRRATADGRVRLERADFKVMRKFGLDPNNPRHVKEFARNKLEAEREHQARSRA